MTEAEIRALVREVVARRMPPAPAPSMPATPGAGPCVPLAAWQSHASHLRLLLPAGRDGDGPCLVEPSVGCTHCGFCQSYGH
jgi:hypothetical protein